LQFYPKNSIIKSISIINEKVFALYADERSIKMSVLFINACVREHSRTLVLAKHVMKDISEEITEVNLNIENIEPLDRALLEKRDRLVRERNFNDPLFRYANQFAKADQIIIAAPFWDLSFPAKLKIYLEQITVAGITFQYINGHPTGLCNAKSLTYVTTSGGPIFDDFGYAYVKTLAEKFYGIKKTSAVRAMNLDMDMISAQDLLQKATISVIDAPSF
jgi:FMN-dependent NADH-azoreductase